MKTIVFSTKASRQFDALPEQAKIQVNDALTDYAVTGEGDVKRLQGRREFRLRIDSIASSSTRMRRRS